MNKLWNDFNKDSISHPTAMEFFETNFYQATPYIDQFGWQNVDSKETLSSLDQTQVCLDSLRPQMEQCLYLNRLSLDSKFICVRIILTFVC